MMRELLGVLTMLALTLIAPAQVFADAADEARVVGAAATSAIRGGLSTQPARDMTPGYTTNPPQASTSPLDVNTATATLLALCQANTSDPSCEAILQAQSDAAIRRATPSMASDPSVLAAQSIVKSSVLAGVAGGYSGCGTDSTTRGGQFFSTESCYNYYLRSVDQPCTKNLQVSVSWSCSQGATGPYTQNGNHYCDRAHIEYSCNADETPVGTTCQYPSTRAADQTTFPVQVASVLLDSTWTCSAGTSGPFYQPLIDLHYCLGSTIQYSCQTGETPLNIDGSQMCQKTLSRSADETIVTVQEAAIPTVNQWWDNSCSSMEARVPPGMLPPDGQQDPGTLGSPTGGADKCERASSVCSDASPTTRIFDTVAVSNSCWQYSNTFSCVNLDARSDCGQPRWGSCQTQGTPVCVDYDPIDSTICTATRQDFSCMTADTTHTESSVNCSGQRYTDPSGQGWDASHAPDTNFGQTVVMLEAAREAGVYMKGTPANLELFKGFDNRCVKKLFGMVNCCNKTGGLNFSAFSNYSAMMQAGTYAGHAMASTYTYDTLFASDAPDYVLQGFEAMFDAGYSSMFAGFMAGDIATVDLLAELVPGPWTIAILAIQYSGILSCPQDQQITSIKRGGNLCVDLGDYCSSRLKWIRTCIERTQTACCFNSKLAKAINVQGKAQLGHSMGSAQGPNCSGFTPDDFTTLDLSTMDFSEFMQDIQAQAIDTSSTASRADPAKCYYGSGKCN